MKKHYNNRYYQSDKNIKYKSSASFLYQKFLGIDKRMRRNIVIGVSMLTIVLVTGVVLAMISLVQFGGSLIDDAFGEAIDEARVRSGQLLNDEKIKNNVEKGLLHVDKTLFKKEN